MANEHEKAAARVARMDWSAFADGLRGASRGPRGAADASAIERYFEADELAELRQLAAHAAARRDATKAGTVVVLHGIMGASLETVDAAGDADLVWINFLRLAKGDVERLRLRADGAANADSRYTVRTAGLDKRTYAKAILWLQARWTVVPFAYDWRLDIDRAARALADCIRRQRGGEPVHLVAHSMGGLVSRNFIRLHPELWRAMRDVDGRRGGRLVMLGTPNYGSYAIPQALTGEETLVRWLAAADVRHSRAELLATLDSFVGSYQMLPAPSRLPAGAEALYRVETWGAHPVSARHLERALRFHAELAAADTVDPDRMAYIAGSGRETLSGVQVLGDGEFLYSSTMYGDGRVPHALGRLEGVPTYFVDETHGDLPRNARVLAAIDDLLESGRTSALPTQAPPVRALIPEGRWRRPAVEAVTLRQVQRVAREAERDAADDDELRRAEDEVSRAVAGRAPRGLARDPVPTRAAAEREVTLRVRVLQADVTKVATRVLVAGHYKGVTPVNAVGALDRAMGHWITEIQKRGMMSADLGEVFFVPTTGAAPAARAILLAGMGDAGHFGVEELRYVMANVTYAVGMLGIAEFASLLVGSGVGNLSRDLALRTFLAGVADGLRRLPAGRAVTRVTLVEKYREPCHELAAMLRQYDNAPAARRRRTGPAPAASGWSIPGLRVAPQLPTRFRPDPRARAAGGRARAVVEPATGPRGPRVTVECDGNRFRFSAMTDAAVVPVREVTVKPRLAHDAADYLRRAASAAEQEKYGRLLATYLVPQDFQGLLDSAPLTLVLDRSTAGFPWEMACVRTAAGVRWFGTTLQLTRQFRTMLSQPVGIAPPPTAELRVLVIADPAAEPELQLPGARAEGRAVVAAIEAFKSRRRIDVVSRIGAAECDPVEILALVLSGDYDVIHYAGHGIFDEQAPQESGWVFARDCVLSPTDIFQARRVPHLVFANACFSAGIREGTAFRAGDGERRLAGLAEAFFERGARNYIGTGWPVDDGVAAEVATTFYREFLAGASLADSLATARRGAQRAPSSTWGAYQHYGWANETLPPAPSEPHR